MRQLVTKGATADRVGEFISSFATSNYFASCRIEIVPEGETGFLTIMVTPLTGNYSVTVYLRDLFINPANGYVEGGLVFQIEEIDKIQQLSHGSVDLT